MSASIIPFHQKYLPEVRDIFFESSTKKDFKDEAEKEAFYYKYLGFYLEHFPELCLVAVDEKVLGYVVGSPDTENAELLSIQPHLKTFEEYFNKYPAHLHINCHADSRGRGVGSSLILEMVEALQKRKIKGLHIMTGPDAENKCFYKKLGFNFQVVQDFRGSPILLMGKEL